MFSPDNCAVMARAGDNMRVLDVGCSPFVTPATLSGTSGAWSPDGRWVVVAGPREITFVPSVGTEASPVTWPVGAADIFWRRS